MAAVSGNAVVMGPFSIESRRVYLSVSRDDDTLDAELAGHWRGADLSAIDAELAAQSFAGARALRVRVPQDVHLDLAGAWRLREWLQAAAAAGLEVSFEGAEPGQLALIESTVSGQPHAPPRSSSEPEFEPVSALGRQVTRRLLSVKAAVNFIGHACMTLLRACTSWRRLRPTSIARHLYETGVTAIPIVSLIAFLITLIIAYIAAQQAREYGAEIFVVDIVTVGVLRELVVLLTAIIVAGRSDWKSVV